MANLQASEDAQIIYSVAESAKKLGVSDTTVYRQIYAGNLKVLSGFGRIRIPLSELEKITGRLTTYEPKPRPKRKQRRPEFRRHSAKEVEG